MRQRRTSNSPALAARIMVLLMLMTGALGAAQPVHASGNITVDTATDELASPGDGCSLREAIFNANTDTNATYPECATGSGDDFIHFSGPMTITLDSGLGALEPASNIEIVGGGASGFIIQASTCDPTPLVPGCTTATYPVFSVSGGVVGIGNLTIRHGASTSLGGGIYNNGGTVDVYLTDIAYNYAPSSGAGVYNASGAVQIGDSTVEHNVSGGGGAGLYNGDSMLIYRSSFSNNESRGSVGGGVYQAASGTGQISNSTFAYNSANIAGGLYNLGALSLENSTVAENTDALVYGGLLSDAGSSLDLRNTLLANNSGNDCTSASAPTGDVGNLIENNYVTNPCGSPSVTSDPGTLTWQAHPGNNTFVLAIDASSSAYEAGDFPTCGAAPVNGWDQGLYPRKAASCDIGAYEFHPAPSNDEYAGATVISGLPYSDTLDTVGATTGISPADPAIPCVGDDRSHSVWYSYTPAASGVLVVDTIGSDDDTVLQVWTGTPGSFANVACNDNTPGFGNQSSVAFAATGGTAYTIELTSAITGGVNVILNVAPRPVSTAGVHDGATYFLRNSNSAGAADLTFDFGWAGAGALVGDWDGNGTTTVGIDDAGSFFLRNSNSPGAADVVFTYGWAGAAPIMGDWDGNGTQTAGIFDAGNFFLRNSNSPGAADLTFGYGWAGAIPLVGDWDGNGTQTIGIYDPATGTFFLRNSNAPGPANLTFGFGPTGSTPVVGDWNGDGVTTIGVFTGGVFYLRNSNTPGSANVTFPYAWSTASPVMGDWDGLP